MMEKILNNKWLKIGLLSVLGLVLAGGLIFAGMQTRKRQTEPIPQPAIPTPTEPTLSPDETAGWKTYTNTKYGYLVRYPSEWYVYEDEDILGNYATRVQSFEDLPDGTSEPIGGPRGTQFIIDHRPKSNPSNLAISEWLRTKQKIDESTEKETIDVSGIPSILLLPEPANYGGRFGYSVWIPKNSKVYTIYMGDPKRKDKEKLFLILSTFKFLD